MLGLNSNVVSRLLHLFNYAPTCPIANQLCLEARECHSLISYLFTLNIFTLHIQTTLEGFVKLN